MKTQTSIRHADPTKHSGTVHSGPWALAPILLLGLVLMFNIAQGAVPSGPPVFTNPLNITNAFHPFQPGAIKIYSGNDGEDSATGLDLHLEEIRTFNWNGTTVACHILREVNFVDGKLVEISDNYFAQSDDGAVRYFGETVKIYEGGVIVSNEGSWLVGGPTLPGDPADTGVETDPTLFMPANPEKGDVFKPEDLFPIVDETAEVLRTNRTIIVPAGKYTDAIVVQETSAISPGKGQKTYAPGVGVIRAKSKDELLELVASTLEQP